MESTEKVDAIGSRLPAEAMRILKSLASQWDDIIDVDGLQMIRLKGAMTNEVYQIKWPTNRERSRKTLSACDLRDPDISALIASKLKEFHDLDMPGAKKALVWDRLREWLNAAKSMCSAEETGALRLDAIEEEIEILYKCLASDQHIAFCHNDLQYGNIMIDEDTRSITIIDYEYACYNPFMFDIANHFCEMAADYHTETPHALEYSKYPDLEERRRFLQVYLSSSGNHPINLDINNILEEVEKYTLASHLLWGLWGVISEHVNEIDFDYMEYAKQRFHEYWLQKPKIKFLTVKCVKHGNEIVRGQYIMESVIMCRGQGWLMDTQLHETMKQ
ncbi:hypothetical protein E3N88_33364 [Mikania micrantha]|uniref:Choline kinase N-terminal domain-containing protein n=1 Tax=Mikania micrantha TaxID=192012 RepID=A0A5N6MBT6_9ASTR|nr:hypothetical protein E3N88_33364 [Mikania micrantha]